MLTKNEKAIASKIAKDLLKEGMLWGEELEEYAKLNAKGLMKFKSDEHYLEFENHLLDMVEKEISREILVKMNDEKLKFTTIKSAAETTGVSQDFLYKNLKKYRACSIIKNKTNIVFEVLRPKLNLI
ncbi:Uncharacterised protein [[Clostridium] sordellii]|uniref:hypothetical protein n=1 Tax=Paraclostridium sordellii TaxID=1505 RepID=UPI0005E82FF1|nr:hypothetical protein [Paeniclostridium sordellii]CEP92081.1 Uncharacterised protein [[Clostridium] sordellii] [Paeniclostridium sordellii]